MDKIQLRLAAVSDIPALQIIENECFQTDMLNSRQMRYMLTKAKAYFPVATVENTVAGYALCFTPVSPRPARLYSLAILPQYRGQGIAGRLMQIIRSKLEELSYTRWRLEVEENNHAAISLYEQLGFRTIAFLPHYYQNGSNSLRMECLLD